MTIPALVGKYEIYVRQQQFKKGYATLETALQKADYDLGGNTECYYSSGNNYRECAKFMDEIANTFKKVKKCENNALANGCLPEGSYKSGEKIYAEQNPDSEDAEDYYNRNCEGFKAENFEKNASAYIMNDGLIMFPYTNPLIKAPIIVLDVNGKKGPNKWGYDLFAFALVKTSPTSGIRLDPQGKGSCHPIEKGGKSAAEYWELMNKGVGRY